MFDSGSGVSQSDIGSGTPLDATLVNADQWSSDVEVGDFILTSSTGGSERYAYSSTGTVGSTNMLLVMVIKSESSVCPVNQIPAILCRSGSATSAPMFGIRYSADEKAYCIGFDNTNTVAAPTDTSLSYNQQWHMIAYKVMDNAIGISIDGGAWTTGSGTVDFPFASGSGPDRYSFGAKVDSTPDTFYDGKVAAVWVVEDGTYANWDDAYIAALYNSGNPWTKFLITSTPIMARMYSNGAFETQEFVQMSSGVPMKINSNNTVQLLDMVEVAGSRGKLYANGTYACPLFIENAL